MRLCIFFFFFFSSRRRHTRLQGDWSSDVCSSDLRGDPPRGNTVNRAPIDASSRPGRPEIVLTHLMEGIGLALDVPGDRMFVTDFGGSIYSARLDGSDKRMLLFAQGNLTGIAYANVVSREK